MAMNGTAMGNEVWTALQAYFDNVPDDHKLTGREGQAIWQIICDKIVDHIQANAVATGTDSRGDTHALTID
jgi:uncharacterized membrane protein